MLEVLQKINEIVLQEIMSFRLIQKILKVMLKQYINITNYLKKLGYIGFIKKYENYGWKRRIIK